MGQVLWNWWVFFSLGFCTVCFLHPQGDLFNWPLCRLHHHKNPKSQKKKWEKKKLLFRNNLVGLISLVKLAWMTRSQYLFKNNFFAFYIQLLCLLNIHFSNCKFLPFCSIDWLRFQKTLAIGPFRIQRYQDLWDKRLGWFLGFQYKQNKIIREWC